MNSKLLTELLDELRTEFPSFNIKPKASSFFMKLVNVLLLVLTLGKQKKFMESFTTTIGSTVYTSGEWRTLADYSRVIILRHERVHLRQAKKYGRFVFAFLYLFCPLPVFYAKWRTQFEMEAYAESMQALHDFGGNLLAPSYRDAMVGHFLGAEYGWMCRDRAKVEQWFSSTLEQVLRER